MSALPGAAKWLPAARNYLAAALINLALVSTTLTPPLRSRVVQVRVITAEQRFRDSELIDCGGDAPGVLSLPYDWPNPPATSMIELN